MECENEQVGLDFRQWYVTLDYQCTLVCGLGSGRDLDDEDRFYCLACEEEEFNWVLPFILVDGVETTTPDDRYDQCQTCVSIDPECRRCYAGNYENDETFDDKPICEECTVPYKVSSVDNQTCRIEICDSPGAPFEAAGVTIVCLNDCLSGFSPIN